MPNLAIDSPIHNDSPPDLDEDCDAELDQLIAHYPKEATEFLTRLRSKNRKKLPTRSVRKTDPILLATDQIGNAPFYSETTYRNFFGPGPHQDSLDKVQEPVLRFGEMPVFTDSILYPTQQRRLQSTTHETYVAKPLSINEPAKPVQPTLKVEGERQFETTHRSVYTPKLMDTPVIRIPKGGRAKQAQLDASPNRIRKPFEQETQFRSDFPADRAWLGVDPNNPCAPQQVQPPKSEIQLTDSNERCFRTEQRDRYKGHDAKVNRVPKSFKREDPPYSIPSIKFSGTTVTKTDFQPYTMNQIREVNPQMFVDQSDACDSSTGLTGEEKHELKTYLSHLKQAKNGKLPAM